MAATRIVARATEITVGELLDLEVYKGMRVILYENLRVEGEYILGSLRPDALEYLPGKFALLRDSSGPGTWVADAHHFLMEVGEDLTLNDRVIRWGDDRQELEASTAAESPTRSGGLPTAREAFDFFPGGGRQSLQQQETEDFGGAVLAVEMYWPPSKQTTKGPHVQGILVAKGGKFFWIRLSWNDWSKPGRYDPKDPDYHKRRRRHIEVEEVPTQSVTTKITLTATHVATPKEMPTALVAGKFFTFSRSFDRTQRWRLFPPFKDGGEQAVVASLLQEASERKEEEPQRSPEKGHQGTVKWFNRSKGYGFITPEEGQKIPGLNPGSDVFVHYNNVMDEEALSEGHKVVFLVREGRKGPEAYNVRAQR